MDAQLSVADGTDMVKERLSTLTWWLHNDLSSEVFDDGTQEVIQNCRVNFDLKSLLVKIYQEGSGMVRLRPKVFLNAAKNWSFDIRQ